VVAARLRLAQADLVLGRTAEADSLLALAGAVLRGGAALPDLVPLHDTLRTRSAAAPSSDR
jgi:hypothetical protein